MKKIIYSLITLLIPVYLHAQVPTVTDLKETDAKQSRDLSIPFSRIVLNPFSFYGSTPQTTQSDFSNRPNLPLNVGYLSTERIGERKMYDLLSLYYLEDNGGGSSSSLSWQGDVSDKKNWYAESSSAFTVQENGLKFTVAKGSSPNYKHMRPASNFMVDFDKTQYLIISIPESVGMWSLKLKNSKNQEVVLRGDAAGSGVFEFNLKEKTGWTGTQSVSFDLWVIGHGSYVVISDVKVIAVTGTPACKEATSYSTAWQPNELPFAASYPDNVNLTGTDFFFDKNTVVRKINFNTNYTGNPNFLLVGKYDHNTTFNNNILYVNNGTFTYAVKSNIFSNNIIYYSSLLELYNQMNGSATPAKSGYWSVKFDLNSLVDKELITALGFSYKNDGETQDILTARMEAPFQSGKIAEQYNAQINYWNDFLRKVPMPAKFDIETVDAKGVTGEQVKQTYYKAWVHVANDVLEADPVNYAYPQVVAGKASMWDESDAKAPYSATWESFFGIQFYGFIDPATAWAAFQGLMSLTDAEGLIGGESLPSRKAQTAWLLYQMTGEKEQLHQCYDALERYLNWRLKYPHWIYANAPGSERPNENQKDAEFVFSAILDLEYMAKISEVIKDKTTAEAWRTKRTNFFNECLPWFWRTPKTTPVQYYNTATHAENPGNLYWVTTGLHIDLLEGEYLKSMYNNFAYKFNTNYNFGGISMGLPKYPDVSYTLYGLFEKGKTTKGASLIDVSLRDVVRDGSFFAEQYESSDNTGTPYPTGVRPSLFGACIMIDFVMIKNGFRYDDGQPHLQNAFSGERSLKGIRFGDKTLNIECDNNGLFTISGNYVEETQTIQTNTGDYKPIQKKNSTHKAEIKYENDFDIYPANNELNVEVKSDLKEKISLKLYGLDGKLQNIFMNNQQVSKGKYTFPLGNLPSQTYCVVVETKSIKIYSKKIII